jgi:phage terminase Nu1 subunit (DNA packaging protein)
MNKQALAIRCHVSLNTVAAWLSKGCPHTKGKAGQYIFDLKAVQHWRKQAMPAKPTTTPAATDISYSAARARKETALAGLRELQLRQREGELIEVVEVSHRLFTLHRQIRQALQNIPARVSGGCAAAKDQHAIFAILTKEIHQALQELTDEEDANTKDDHTEPARPHATTRPR